MATKKPQPEYLSQRPAFNYDALDQFLSSGPAPEAEKVEPRGKARAVADTGLSFGQGAVQGVRMLTDLAGADNAVSGGLRTVEDFIGGLKSAQAKKDQQEAAAILKAAEGAGILDQVIAGAKAFGVAPVETLAQAAGTSIPTIATALIPGVGPIATAGRFGAALGMGAAQGAGSVKSSIYDEVLQAQTAADKSPGEAQALAAEAQAYSGQNAGQIALGAGLGAWAGRSGIEGAASKLLHGGSKAAPGMAARVGMGAVAEGIPEAAQGAQEKYATNTALANQGFAVDPWSGVAANATMEGLAGHGMGAVMGIPRPAHRPGDQLRAEGLQPEIGPSTSALNAAVEAAAQKVDAGAPMPAETPAVPVSTGSVAEGQGEALAPVVEPAPVEQPTMPANDPATMAAAVAQREADRPPEPTGEILPGDILTKSGNPFKSMMPAMAALNRAGADTHELVRVDQGLVIRKKQGAQDAQPGVAEPAGMAAGAADGTSPVDGRSDGPAPGDTGLTGPGSYTAGPEPVPSSGEAVSVGSGSEPDAALTDDLPTLRKQWQQAAQSGNTDLAKQISDRMTALKKEAQPAPAVDVAPKPVEPVDTSPKRVDETPKNVQIEPTPELPMLQPEGGPARVVKVNGKEFALTPDQRAEMERVEAAFKARFDAAKLRYERTKANPLPDNPDAGLRSAKEQFDAEQKALGFQLSAERRRIVGALTPKETKAKAEQDARIRPGDAVTTPEGQGTVTGLNFGRVRVQVNGNTRTFPRDKVQKSDAAVQQAPTEAPRGEAPAPAGDMGAPAAQTAVPGAASGAVEAAGLKSGGADAFYESLIGKASTSQLSSSGGRTLYDVQVTPAMRTKYHVNGRFPETNGFQLRPKADVTGVPSDRGYVLIDKREQHKKRTDAATPPATEVKATGAPDGDQAKEASPDEKRRRQEEGLLNDDAAAEKPVALIELRKRLSVLEALKGCLKS